MDIPTLLANVASLVLILIGFGLVITLHELGHFFAARWAGVRVLTFSVGFGRPLLSYRPGLGWRRGPTHTEYHRRVNAGEAGLSPTEYRLSVIPLGGYVKMLGQDDADPGHRSSEPDSYNSVAVWKRMIIISAGVVFNVVSAAALFIIAFSIGLPSTPSIVGHVDPDGAAAQATVLSGPPGSSPGLQTGDRITSIEGRGIRTFQDVFIAVAMSEAGKPLDVVVDRPGLGLVELRATPEASPVTQLLELGIAPARSPTLLDAPADDPLFVAAADSIGVPGLVPGSTLVSIGAPTPTDEPPTTAHALTGALTESLGRPVPVVFETPRGERLAGSIEGEPVLSISIVKQGTRSVELGHVLGFQPVMAVGPIDEASEGWAKGLRPGDVFVRLGDAEFPSVAAGRGQIREHSGRDIEAVVRREDPSGTIDVPLTLSVSDEGFVGFSLDAIGRASNLIARPVGETVSGRGPLPAARAGLVPGTSVLAVDGEPVSDYVEFVRALSLADASGAIEVTVLPPFPGAGEERVSIELSADEARSLASLEWQPTGYGLSLFETESFVLRGRHPVEAAALGFGETRRVMETTYITFVRLFEGSIQVDKLSGPIGIVHTGTLFVERGLAWILFFFGMVSVNLAVINFLPIPITDGGHMVFLLYEQVTGKPVSVVVQNIATLAGLACLGVVFLVVTYNDILRLFGLAG